MPNENKLPAISSKDLNYLRNIHIMRSIFLVVSVDYFFGDILDRKLLLKEFPANESVFRFLKRDTFVEIFGGQPGVMHLVHFPAGFGFTVPGTFSPPCFDLSGIKFMISRTSLDMNPSTQYNRLKQNQIHD